MKGLSSLQARLFNKNWLHKERMEFDESVIISGPVAVERLLTRRHAILLLTWQQAESIGRSRFRSDVDLALQGKHVVIFVKSVFRAPFLYQIDKCLWGSEVGSR